MTTRWVDREAAEPLHVQLRRALLADVKKRGLTVGDQLPSEPEIAAIYQVSRTTIRQSLNSLVTDGVVHRIQGKGTFLADPPTAVPRLTSSGALTSFSRNLLAQGHVPSVRTLTSRRDPSPRPGTVGHADDGYEGECRYLLRLLLADGRPICLQETWIPLAAIDGRDESLAADVLAGGSLYDALTAPPLELALHHGVETVSVGRADALCAELIECADGDPVLHAQRLAHLHDSTLAEYTRMRFHADRYSYRVEMGALGD